VLCVSNSFSLGAKSTANLINILECTDHLYGFQLLPKKRLGVLIHN
jgi:hypothetical protein